MIFIRFWNNIFKEYLWFYDCTLNCSIRFPLYENSYYRKKSKKYSIICCIRSNVHTKNKHFPQFQNSNFVRIFFVSRFIWKNWCSIFEYIAGIILHFCNIQLRCSQNYSNFYVYIHDKNCFLWSWRVIPKFVLKTDPPWLFSWKFLRTQLDKTVSNHLIYSAFMSTRSSMENNDLHTETAIKKCLRKRCSENLQQNYKRTPMPKSNLNKNTLKLFWNHTSAWFLFCKFVAYF